jgi:hypothetical protein
MQKFKRSIKALVDGLILQRFGTIDQTELTENERLLLQEILTRFDINNDIKNTAITSITDPNPYNI